ncbi:MAG: DNA/RNA nuclease SfsA, partial [Chloroflexi bacterium]|nr:DNA/RNA nuclease SfsA [Chloroflexota bacterium]
DGRGLFPDAPTERGRRHVRSLMEARGQGDRAAALFVVQRADADAFAPHDEADPEFGETLREAHATGVEIYAYRCNVTREEITLDSPLPVLLG